MNNNRIPSDPINLIQVVCYWQRIGAAFSTRVSSLNLNGASVSEYHRPGGPLTCRKVLNRKVARHIRRIVNFKRQM